MLGARARSVSSFKATALKLEVFMFMDDSLSKCTHRIGPVGAWFKTLQSGAGRHLIKPEKSSPHAAHLAGRREKRDSSERERACFGHGKTRKCSRTPHEEHSFYPTPPMPQTTSLSQLPHIHPSEFLSATTIKLAERLNLWRRTPFSPFCSLTGQAVLQSRPLRGDQWGASSTVQGVLCDQANHRRVLRTRPFGR